MLTALSQILEHLCRGPTQPRTLFATHFHELAAADVGDMRRATVELVTDPVGRPMITHRVVDGVATSSFGLHVAERAGVPAQVVQRARELVGAMDEHLAVGGGGREPTPCSDDAQPAAEREQALVSELGRVEARLQLASGALQQLRQPLLSLQAQWRAGSLPVAGVEEVVRMTERVFADAKEA